MKEEQTEINVQIGKRLQEIRENLGYTQENFAEILDVDTAHYRKLERGRHSLSSDKMLVLYKKYKIDPTYLITGDKNWNCFLRIVTEKRETSLLRGYWHI